MQNFRWRTVPKRTYVFTPPSVKYIFPTLCCYLNCDWLEREVCFCFKTTNLHVLKALRTGFNFQQSQFRTSVITVRVFSLLRYFSPKKKQDGESRFDFDNSDNKFKKFFEYKNCFLIRFLFLWSRNFSIFNTNCIIHNMFFAFKI